MKIVCGVCCRVCIYVAVCLRMSAEGGVTEAAKTVESENKMKRYVTVEEKVAQR